MTAEPIASRRPRPGHRGHRLRAVSGRCVTAYRARARTYRHGARVCVVKLVVPVPGPDLPRWSIGIPSALSHRRGPQTEARSARQLQAEKRRTQLSGSVFIRCIALDTAASVWEVPDVLIWRKTSRRVKSLDWSHLDRVAVAATTSSRHEPCPWRRFPRRTGAPAKLGPRFVSGGTTSTFGRVSAARPPVPAPPNAAGTTTRRRRAVFRSARP
jgi:hypothetical protein